MLAGFAQLQDADLHRDRAGEGVARSAEPQRAGIDFREAPPNRAGDRPGDVEIHRGSETVIDRESPRGRTQAEIARDVCAHERAVAGVGQAAREGERAGAGDHARSRVQPAATDGESRRRQHHVEVVQIERAIRDRHRATHGEARAEMQSVRTTLGEVVDRRVGLRERPGHEYVASLPILRERVRSARPPKPDRGERERSGCVMVEGAGARGGRRSHRETKAVRTRDVQRLRNQRDGAERVRAQRERARRMRHSRAAAGAVAAQRETRRQRDIGLAGERGDRVDPRGG